jgi:two-component system response regulator PilR (NtrC family)
MASKQRILLVTADPETRRALSEMVRSTGLECRAAASVAEARALVARERPALVFCDRRLADGSFRELLGAEEVQEANVPVVVASRLGETDEYLEAMRLGAFDFIAKPYHRSEVEQIVHNALHSALVA